MRGIDTKFTIFDAGYYDDENIEEFYANGIFLHHGAQGKMQDIQTDDTFCGHLLLTFIATMIIILMQDRLLDRPYNPFSMFMNLRNLKCKIYEDRIITAEPFKKANDCFKLFSINCPDELMLLE